MPTHSILQSKIQELEEALKEAQAVNNYDLVQMYNRELIGHLLRLSDALRGNPTADRGTDSGEL